MKLTLKLSLAFATSVALILILGLVNIYSMKSMSANINEIATNWLPCVRELSAVSRYFADIRRFQLLQLTAPTDALKQQHDKSRIDALDKMKVRQKTYEPMISNDEERKAYQDFTKYSAEYFTLSDKLTDLLKQGKTDEATRLSNEDIPRVVTPAQEALARGVEINEKGATVESANGQAAYESARILSIFMLSLAVVIGVLLGFFVPRSIVGPVSKCVAFANRLAVGDTSLKLEVQSKDEIGVMAEAMRQVGKAETHAADLTARISKGDLDVDITPRCEKDTLLISMGELVRAEKIRSRCCPTVGRGQP